MTESVWILGIAMTKFGRHSDLDIVDLAAAATLAALTDAGISMSDIGIIAAGNLLRANEGIGQQLQKQVGQNGAPVYNVANTCATGATAVRVVNMALKSGETDVGLAVGVEKLAGTGLLANQADAAPDTWTPSGRLGAVTPLDGVIGTDSMPGLFAQIGIEYLNTIGSNAFDVFARISEKNHAHSTLNPLAMYTKRLTLEQILGDMTIAYPNTRPMCSANCDGAAAAVLVSESRLRTLSLAQQRRAVKVSASVLTSDPWEPSCQVLPDVNTLTRDAARQAYEAAGIGPEDLDLVELHDCFATAELVHYDNLQLSPPGEALTLFESGATWRDGRIPVNVSGGLESKGHPIAATGIANLFEIATQLRGEAKDRQIDGARVGLAHVIGLGSACGVHILERASL